MLETYHEVAEASAFSDDPVRAHWSLVVSLLTTGYTFRVETMLALSCEQPVIQQSQMTVMLPAQQVLKDNLARLTATVASRSTILPSNYNTVIATCDEQMTLSSVGIAAAQTMTSRGTATTLASHKTFRKLSPLPTRFLRGKDDTHDQLTADQLGQPFITSLEKKNKAVKIKIRQTKIHISILANVLIENLTFKSQIKEQLMLSNNAGGKHSKDCMLILKQLRPNARRTSAQRIFEARTIYHLLDALSQFHPPGTKTSELWTMVLPVDIRLESMAASRMLATP